MMLAGACIARPAIGPSGRAVGTATSRATLASGVRATFEAAPDFGTAGVVWVVDAGSADDPPGKGGLAHLVEHLVFEARHGDARLVSKFKSLGVGRSTYNGSTLWDSTTYYAFGPSQNLPALLALFGDMLSDPLASIDLAAFEHERQVVRDELHFRVSGSGLTWLAADVFGDGHPYAHGEGGDEASIDRLTLEDARAFARLHYRPDHSVLAVSGPSSLQAQQDMLAQVEAAHGWVAAPPAAGRTHDPKDAPEGGPSSPLSTRPLAVATPELWIGWAIPPEGSPISDAAVLVANMVGATFWHHVYDHDSDIARVAADVEFGADASLFYVVANLKQGADPKSSADSLIRTMRHGFSEYLGVPFAPYKQAVATELLGAQEPLVARTRDAATSLEIMGDPAYLRARAERTLAVESNAVADFYRRELTSERAHVLLVRPLSPGERSGAIAGDESVGTRVLEPDSAPADDGNFQSWMHPPGIARAKRVRLDNGLEVVVLPRPRSPFHTVVLAYHGGNGDERTPGAAVASLWAKERTRMAAAALGVAYRDWVGSDLTLELLRSAGSDLDLTFRELKNEHEFRVFWPPSQFSSRVDVYGKQDRAADNVFDRRLSSVFFGSHPYGRSATSDDLRAVRPKDVYAFIDAIRRPDNGLVVVVGDVDPDRALRIIAEQLGGGHAAAADSVSAPPPPLEAAADAPGARLIVQNVPGRADARLAFRCVLPRLDGENSGSAAVFEAAVSGEFYEELRERTAASYAINGHVITLRGGTALFALDGKVDTAHLALAIGAVRRFVDQPAARFLDEARFTNARRSAASGFNFAFDTTELLALRIANTWNLGWPLETLDGAPERIEHARIDEVTRLLERCQTGWALGLLGDETRIRSALGDWNP
jgi:zinc protease